jgi:competence protein ComGA
MEERLIECLRIALRNHVTDIHFSMHQEGSLLIEMRVNGVIRQLKEQTGDARFFRYLLYRANMDVSNTLQPQTGRFEAEVDGELLALRFALLSSYHITSGVLRILNNHDPLQISMLCSDPDQTAWLKQITGHRAGLYVFCGPTGSGKTTTLYTILNETEGKKIYTLEDPVEVFSEKYVQIQVNEKQHMGYADGIKQLMRHDPDIIMIGEIRDQTAAEMAVRSALTGHLVLTSLHSSSCVNAVERLLDLGVTRIQLEDVLAGVSSQRLYDTHDHHKIGVYETMNQQEVSSYFRTGCVSQTFIPLQKRIEQAVSAGIIDSLQASQDIAG